MDSPRTVLDSGHYLSSREEATPKVSEYQPPVNGEKELPDMSRQVSCGSAGEYQADEQAGVARLSWRVSGR